MKKDFDLWLTEFKTSISNYGYYVNFRKVYDNVDAIKIELNILNSLIGSNNIADDFENIVNKYPEVLKCIPILLAVRGSEVHAMDENGEYCFSFKKMNYSAEEYKYFMEKIGLFELLENRIVNNLIDYVTGVETGLDSNGRKNRGGHLMEDLVERYLIKSGVKYFKEMRTNEISDKWDIDLSSISNRGKTVKRFDFVVKTDDSVYAIETNFYKSGGSKLNETARSYKNISLESSKINNFEFIWITDGMGWYSARNNLRETYDIMEHIYSINDMENGVFNKIFK